MIEQMTRLGMDVEYEVFCLMMLVVFDVASMDGWVVESNISNQWNKVSVSVTVEVSDVQPTDVGLSSMRPTNYSRDR